MFKTIINPNETSSRASFIRNCDSLKDAYDRGQMTLDQYNQWLKDEAEIFNLNKIS